MLEPQQAEESTQLLVEGNDQVNFFRTLLERLRIGGVQIQNFGGVKELPTFLETLAAGQEFRTLVIPIRCNHATNHIQQGSHPSFPRKRESIRLPSINTATSLRIGISSVGIVRDAESKIAQSAFQSIQSSLRRVNLPVPERMNQRFGNSPAVSVFILPDNQSSGMLETLLCKTLEGTQMSECIDGFFECVTSSSGEDLRRPDKSRAFAYISIMSYPNVSVGVAAKKKYWDLDHPVFDDIRVFLRSL